MTRRIRLRLGAVLLAALGAYLPAGAGEPPARPNILWITCEDISPNLGCYGDSYAVTPNLDRLAAEGVRYTFAFAPIGVCAPSRSSLILGMYASSVGTSPMRCRGLLPPWMKAFPQYLRDAGYYCTNNVKTDYNFDHDPATWDESSNRAHWRGRREGQPFFAVFNFTTTHESQIRQPEEAYQRRTANFTSEQRHDPARAPLPPYHPDTPEVRRDWARYADLITVMDGEVRTILDQLREDGLEEETIVFYFSDHGAGMPRSKRWLYDSSTKVPLIVRFPERFRSLAPGEAGSTCDRLVTFVDFGPTVLSLAGVPVPAHMQGVPFLGAQEGPPRRYVHGFRDRMDERQDMLRSIRDRRYKYIRNYQPQRPWFGGAQYVSYMYEMPTMQAWQRLADAGKLAGPAATFMAASKPFEELYDTEADPWEVNNLAGSAEHAGIRDELSRALDRWLIQETIDLGFLPEADLRTRFGDEAPYAAVRRDPTLYRIRDIARWADRAARRDPAQAESLAGGLADPDPAIRWWAATGLGSLGTDAAAWADRLEALGEDPKPWVRVAAGDALARIGRVDRAIPPLVEALADPSEWVRLDAINALDRLGPSALPAREAIVRARTDPNGYVVRVAERAIAVLSAE